MSDPAHIDIVQGFGLRILGTLKDPSKEYVYLAMRLMDGSLLMAALDAEFMFNLMDAIDNAALSGGFDVIRRHDEAQAASRVRESRIA